MVSREKEYETKVLINKEVFGKLLKTYNLSLTNNTLIKNNYFDTTDLAIFNANGVLRIREKNRSSKTVTFKQALKQHELIEVNQKIKEKQYENILKKGFSITKFKEILEDLNIDCANVGSIGNLITNRWEIPYGESTIFIDHSIYNDLEDYEIECEASNAEKSEKEIIRFCKENGINFFQRSLSKYSRFLKSRKGVL